MLKTNKEPGLITLSKTAYRLLLAFYPTRFRREYGSHMAQVFRDCCLRTYRQSGPLGMVKLWAFTLVDWFKTVIEEQLNRGTEMTRTKFIRLSGWGMVLAAITLLLTFLPEANEIQAGLSQVFGLPAASSQKDRYQILLESVRSSFLPAAILLITVGLVGLRARYGEHSGHKAKRALEAGIFGGMASLVSFVWMDRPITNILMAWMFTGLFVFGLVALRIKPMPRGNGLPVLAGFWWPALVIQAYVFPQVTQGLGSPVPFWFSFSLFSAMSFSLAWLGYVLQADVSRVEATV